ncbi:D-alanyl-D-alanine carboxypeptidase family protein [Nakamurella leprariae]|uniref:Serine hydrolase n=1 Tax=Nakamurella leprariae TaxID=2803911 RepID=A0A938YDL7_9ACTN|nr:D-alanyl-D-alanine carboxypeptidase family protein [Nakamurella leprariae]MBM9467653.1 serine hydrolase [Nakamurella leprariae]
MSTPDRTALPLAPTSSAPRTSPFSARRTRRSAWPGRASTAVLVVGLAGSAFVGVAAGTASAQSMSGSALSESALSESALSGPLLSGPLLRDPYVPPSVTLPSPATDGCPQREVPPPAVDTSEDVPSGVAPPQPLPVPEVPVGGPALGACGLVLPPGADPWSLPPDISAASWLIADLDSGQVLAAKDPHGRYRPASVLKLLSAQVYLRNLTDLDAPVEATVTDTAQEGTRTGIEAGAVYSVRQLLTYLLIDSGNDAANALARANGGYDKTVAEMNELAAELGAFDTRAATVSGLDGPGQSVSAYDLALFARLDMDTPPFPQLITEKAEQVPALDGPGYFVPNDNQLTLQYPGGIGGKTGFTDDAGNTFVGMAERNGRRLVVTMLGGTQRPRPQWMQAASLLDWGFALDTSTRPVGRLVDSAADAAADGTAASGTPTPPAPTSGTDPSDGGSSVTPTAGTTSTESGLAADHRSSDTPGWVAWTIAGGGLLILALIPVAVLWTRRRSARSTHV